MGDVLSSGKPNVRALCPSTARLHPPTAVDIASLALSHPAPPPLPPHHFEVLQEFEEHGWTKFTPHYIVWVCPSAYRDSEECMAQCIRNGRYCSPDPDGNLKEGYSGADVVQVGDGGRCVWGEEEGWLPRLCHWYGISMSYQCIC